MANSPGAGFFFAGVEPLFGQLKLPQSLCETWPELCVPPPPQVVPAGHDPPHEAKSGWTRRPPTQAVQVAADVHVVQLAAHGEHVVPLR